MAFYRGLFQTAAHARRFAPHGDPLLDALQEVRMIEILGQFRDRLGLSQLSDSLDRYASIMMGLPQKLDAVLTLMAESSAQLKLQRTGEAAHRRQKNSSSIMTPLLLVLAAVVLLAHHLAASVGAGVWLDRITAIAFVVLGALLLRAAGRV